MDDDNDDLHISRFIGVVYLSTMLNHLPFSHSLHYSVYLSQNTLNYRVCHYLYIQYMQQNARCYRPLESEIKFSDFSIYLFLSFNRKSQRLQSTETEGATVAMRRINLSDQLSCTIGQKLLQSRCIVRLVQMDFLCIAKNKNARSSVRKLLHALSNFLWKNTHKHRPNQKYRISLNFRCDRRSERRILNKRLGKKTYFANLVCN